MNDIPEERCSCSARPKHKCCKESTVGGKMCVKPFKIADELDDLNVTFLKAKAIIESLENKDVKMRTIKQNLEFLIDGLGEWRENNDI